MIIYATLRYSVSSGCFVHVFPGPRISVYFFVYSLYTAKVWRNLNTPLNPSHPYRTRIVSWNINCHKCNIFIGSHQNLQQEGKFYTEHHIIVHRRSLLYVLHPVLYMIYTIYMIPTSLFTLSTIHQLIIFLLIRDNWQDLGQTVRNVFFRLNEPNFLYTSLRYLTDSTVTDPQIFIWQFLMGNRCPFDHATVFPKHDGRL